MKKFITFLFVGLLATSCTVDNLNPINIAKRAVGHFFSVQNYNYQDLWAGLLKGSENYAYESGFYITSHDPITGEIVLCEAKQCGGKNDIQIMVKPAREASRHEIQVESGTSVIDLPFNSSREEDVIKTLKQGLKENNEESIRRFR